MPEPVNPTAAPVPAPATPEPASVPAVAEKPKLTGAQHAAIRRAKEEARRFESQRAAWEAERTGHASKLQELQAKAEQTQRDLEAAMADPVGWAQKRGVDPNVSIRKFLGDGTPESRIDELTRRSEAAEKRLAEYIADQERKEAERGKQAVEANRAKAIDNVVSAIRANKTEWRYTNVALTEAEIRAKCAEIQRIGEERKESYSWQSIKDAFEEFAKRRYEQILSLKGELLDSSAEGQGTASPAESSAARKGIRQPPASTQPAKTSIPTAQRRRAPLTPKEQEAAYKAQIRAAMDKDRAARLAKSGQVPAPKSTTLKPGRAVIRH